VKNLQNEIFHPGTELDSQKQYGSEKQVSWKQHDPNMNVHPQPGTYQ
jgi:hypothetical protein